MAEDFKSFRRNILKYDKPKVHKVNNSIGVYDAYKWIRKNKWLNIGSVISEHNFYFIVREINNLLIESFLNNNDIKFPYDMGMIELRKRIPTIKIEEGKIKTSLPIDWNKTLKLWHDDAESFKNKFLVKIETKEVFKVVYSKRKAKYKNKIFYEFAVNNTLKRRLKDKIKEGKIDAFLF